MQQPEPGFLEVLFRQLAWNLVGHASTILIVLASTAIIGLGPIGRGLGKLLATLRLRILIGLMPAGIVLASCYSHRAVDLSNADSHVVTVRFHRPAPIIELDSGGRPVNAITSVKAITGRVVTVGADTVEIRPTRYDVGADVPAIAISGRRLRLARTVFVVDPVPTFSAGRTLLLTGSILGAAVIAFLLTFENPVFSL